MAPSNEAVEAWIEVEHGDVQRSSPTVPNLPDGRYVPAGLLADEREAREKLVEALREIAEHKPQSIGTREVHDGEDWKQAEYFEPFAWKHAIGIARAALSGSPEEAR